MGHSVRWDAALLKFRSRVIAIRHMGLGITLALLAFRMLAASVLAYIMQLSPMRNWDAEQAFSVRQLLPGPHQWIPWRWVVQTPPDFPLPIAMPSIAEAHLATLRRTSRLTLSSTRSEALSLCTLFGRDCEPLAHPWRRWRMEAMAIVLHRIRGRWRRSLLWRPLPPSVLFHVSYASHGRLC